METIASLWWLWLLTAVICLVSFGVNWVLVTYGTAIDVGTLAYKASKLKREDLPNTKEEAIEGATKIAKQQALAFAKAKLFSKVRKIFFGVIVLGLGALSALMFVVSLLINLVFWLM